MDGRRLIPLLPESKSNRIETLHHLQDEPLQDDESLPELSDFLSHFPQESIIAVISFLLNFPSPFLSNFFKHSATQADVSEEDLD